VRDKNRFPQNGIFNHPKISVFEADFLKDVNYNESLREIEAAYYLIHSMNSGINDFKSLEEISASNFANLIEQTSAKQIIYLSEMTNEENFPVT
jgi:hypothetical protein